MGLERPRRHAELVSDLGDSESAGQVPGDVARPAGDRGAASVGFVEGIFDGAFAADDQCSLSGVDDAPELLHIFPRRGGPSRCRSRLALTLRLGGKARDGARAGFATPTLTSQGATGQTEDQLRTERENSDPKPCSPGMRHDFPLTGRLTVTIGFDGCQSGSGSLSRHAWQKSRPTRRIGFDFMRRGRHDNRARAV